MMIARKSINHIEIGQLGQIHSEKYKSKNCKNKSLKQVFDFNIYKVVEKGSSEITKKIPGRLA